jgi:hypothetical protein
MMIADRCIGDPPICCQPSPLPDEEWAARTARLASARKRAYERQPRACPNCGSDEIAPVFDPDGTLWTCECGNVWEAGR